MIRKQDIKQIVETDSIKETNKFLEEGFVLMETNKQMNGTIKYVLGLAKKEE